MKKNDGGPAFACASENGYQPGMTRRQWLAGMAMQALIIRGVGRGEELQRKAYREADDMLAYEEEENGKE